MRAMVMGSEGVGNTSVCSNYRSLIRDLLRASPDKYKGTVFNGII